MSSSPSRPTGPLEVARGGSPLRVPTLLLLTLCLCPSQQLSGKEPSTRVILESAEGRSYFRVVGLDGWNLDSLSDEDLALLFAVYVGTSSAELPPLLGSHSLENGSLIFRPRFPLQPGLHYQTIFDPGALNPGVRAGVSESNRITTNFDIPKRIASEATTVEAVYPSTNRVPENLLKFYLYFSAPMSRGQVYRFVRLFDESDRVVETPFLEIEQELWDSDQRRLTLFIDPGRIKRGLLPLEEVGTALVAGKQYRMVIEQKWPDAREEQLNKSFEKTFTVGPPDRAPLDPQSWSLEEPRAHSREPLCVKFDEPLDYALLLRLLQVVEPGGTSVPGAAVVSNKERLWCFQPDEPWPGGEFYLSISTALEDLAGNKIGRPFDVDVFEQVEDRIVDKRTRLPFRIAKD